MCQRTKGALKSSGAQASKSDAILAQERAIDARITGRIWPVYSGELLSNHEWAATKKSPASAQIATALAYGNTQCYRRWHLALAAAGCGAGTTSPRRSIGQPTSACGYRRRNPMPFKLSSGRRYLYGELLPGEMIETRLKDCSQDWISACQSAIAAAPEEFVDDLLSAISLAVRVERNRRANAPAPETERRSTLTFFHPG